MIIGSRSFSGVIAPPCDVALAPYVLNKGTLLPCDTRRWQAMLLCSPKCRCCGVAWLQALSPVLKPSDLSFYPRLLDLYDA
jgi:hypothetical protein